MTEDDIRNEMNRAYNAFFSRSGNGGWRGLGETIGVSGAYARQVALGEKPVTLSIAEAWLISNGWKPPQKVATCCPTCAKNGNYIIHGEGLDCNGKPVSSVACLAPGETVKPAPRRKTTRRRYWRPTLPIELQAKARRAGLTAADVRAAIERAIAERDTAGQ